MTSKKKTARQCFYYYHFFGEIKMYIIFEECAATGMTIAKTSQLSLIFNPAFHAEILNKSLIDFFIQNSTD